MAATIPTLPPEIYKEIIDHFAFSIPQHPSPEFLDSMQAISLTCQTFLPLARRHIFRQIDMGGTHDTSSVRWTRLATLLEREPYTARSVETMSYSFYAGQGHLLQDAVEVLLRCLASLPCVKTLSIVMRPAWHLKARSWIDVSNPVFGWDIILQEFISKRVTLEKLSITGLPEFPYIRILSLPTVHSLVLDNCYMDEDDEQAYQCAIEANHSTLTSLRCYGTYPTISFAFIAQCTQLSELTLGSTISYPQVDEELHSSLGFNTNYTGHLFQKLTKAEFTNGLAVQWKFFLNAASRGEGFAVFPELRDLTMGLKSRCAAQRVGSDDDIYKIFKHMPMLENLKIQGCQAVGLDFSKALNPLSTTVKTISLHCDFESSPFNDESSSIKMSECLRTLEDLNLTALETLSLHVQLKTGIYERDESTNPPRAIYRSVAKSVLHTINNTFLKDYGSHFALLSRVEVKITLMVHHKPQSDDPEKEAPYRRKAIRALKRYLGGIDTGGRFVLVWEANVFRRCFGEDGESEDEVGGEGEDETSDEEG